MAREREFAGFVVESLRPLGPVSARRMFGGHGIFMDGLMFGLIADAQLYLKVDEGNRAAYEAEGLQPFTYARAGGWRCPTGKCRARASTTPTSCAHRRARRMPRRAAGGREDPHRASGKPSGKS
jgi:TfoX N-terminal domain